ncbi:MAG: type II toxin-antitoxin system RelE/ParE family toxin [Streptosporangiaceae bacterium]
MPDSLRVRRRFPTLVALPRRPDPGARAERPAEGRPLVDTVTASRVANMKELRPPSAGRSEVRILFVFDPWRSAVLLMAGDKSGRWKQWYQAAIPQAEQLYEDYLAEREKEMGL